MKLSKKEIEIIKLIGLGKTNDEIAEKIGVKKNTVTQYIYNLTRIFDVRNRIELYNKVFK